MDKINGKFYKEELLKYSLNLLNYHDEIDRYAYLFSLLSSDYSRKRLIDVFTYKIMGPKYIDFLPNFYERME